MRGQWTIETLKLAIDALDTRYPMSQMCKKYGIPRNSLRDYYVGKRKSRKSRPLGVLTTTEEEELMQYLQEMVRVSCPLNIIQLRTKVAELTQTRWTPFTNGNLGKS